VVDPPVSVYDLGPVRIDVPLRQVVVRGQEIELSRKEFDLLTLLVSESGNVVTRTQCMERIWRDRTKADSRTLDTHVKRLRKKVELTPANPGTSSRYGHRLPLQAVRAASPEPRRRRRPSRCAPRGPPRIPAYRDAVS